MSGNLKPSDVLGLGDGMYCDGDYLWLRVKGDARSWIVRGPRINGKKPEAGLGSAGRISLALARKERDKLLEQWRNGKDPIAERRATRETQANRKTFIEVARLKIAAQSTGWRTSFEGRSSTLDVWTKNMERDCAPIASKAVDEIDINDIKRIVSTYWDRERGNRAGRDLLMRIEMVFSYAIAHGWRSAANPAAWSVFKEIWPAQKAVTARAALPWRDAPKFMRELRASKAVAARIVEFLLLTGTRSEEARGAEWSEIDWAARTWTIPAERMKKGAEHIVPLSDQAIALLERVKAEGVAGDLIFPGYVDDGSRQARDAGPIPNQTVLLVVKRYAGEDLTLHGLRSTFRDWCGEHGIDRELAEHSLAHKFGSAVENAYARSTLVARRAPVMQRWADYCDGKPSGDVLPFKRSA